MNLLIVPKYKKYNSTLNQVYATSVLPKLRARPQVRVEEPKRVPVPIKIEPYRPKKKSHVKIRDSFSNWSRRRHSYEEPVRKRGALAKLFKVDEHDDGEDKSYKSKICRWYARKNALRAIKKDHERELKQLKEWENWKKNEQKLIRKAQLEKAREEREKEFTQQMYDVHKEKQRLAKDTLKTKYPYKVKRKLPSKNSKFDTYDDYQADYSKYYGEPYPAEEEEKVKPKKVTEEKPSKVKKVRVKKAKEKEVKPPKAKKPKKVPMTETTLENIDFNEPSYSSKVKKGKNKNQKELIIDTRPPKRSLSEKFVTCFYKTCCEFYCWFTIFLFIGFTIILLV